MDPLCLYSPTKNGSKLIFENFGLETVHLLSSILIVNSVSLLSHEDLTVRVEITKSCTFSVQFWCFFHSNLEYNMMCK